MIKFLLPLLLLSCSTIINQKGLDNSVAIVAGKNSSGSGFFVDLGRNNQGHVITNAHVCNDEPLVKVNDSVGYVVKLDKKTDLCLIKTNVKKQGFKLATSVERGESVRAFANKRGISEIVSGYVVNPNLTETDKRSLDSANDYCSGKIINLEKLIEEYILKMILAGVPNEQINQIMIQLITTTQGVKFLCEETYTVIQTSLTVLPGFSGSPVVNDSGKVVGVVFIRKTQNTSYLVRLKDLKEFLNEF